MHPDPGRGYGSYLFPHRVDVEVMDEDGERVAGELALEVHVRELTVRRAKGAARC